MAKKKISNYVFKPGISYLDNLYPDAYDLLKANINFLKEESIAYINKEIQDATKCQRDMGYIIDGLAFDMALGTNYNTNFLGFAELNSLDLSNTVIRTIERAKAQVAALSQVSGDATALARSNDAYDALINIVQNGRDAAEPFSYTNPTNATAVRIAAKDKILANLDFMAAEVNAYVAVQYPDADHDVAKCTRDTKYALYAAAYDVLYGGNSASYDSAKFFDSYSASSPTGITPQHQAQTVAGYRHLQTVINSVVRGQIFTPTVGNTESQFTGGPNADGGTATIVSNLIDIVADVVENGLSTLPGTRTVPSVTWTTFAISTAKTAIDTNKIAIIEAITWDPAYTYNQAKCERDLKYVLDAYLYDIRYGGNSETTRVVNFYWDQNVAQIDGNRIPEIDTHAHIGDLIANYVMKNIAWTPLQTTYLQQIDLAKTSLPGAISHIEILSSIVVDVIANGLTALPTYEPTGVGFIKIQGTYDTSDLLLITNTTKNEVIYNFSNPETGAVISTIRENPGQEGAGIVKTDSDFPKFAETTDGVTTITLFYDTSTHSATDDLQIFIDEKELRTRPYDFGTDAIERQRVAPPLSMLDADFEYGLQPTKWSAISMLRGYPGIYEVPGTEKDVISVVTDASVGTEGVGASKITVTTVGPHQLTSGTPITIKALENSISGASRAEGSFIVVDILADNIFTYYAKAKVGTTDGDVLSTSYTQLREGAFYTGAAVGQPVFSISSNGSAGTLTTALDVDSGATRIPFTGDAPEVGAPLVGLNIPLGSQVTNVVGTGGIVVTPLTSGDVPSGSLSIPVTSVANVVTGLALDRGDGYATFVTGIDGQNITISDPLTSSLVGNSVDYVAVAGTNVQIDGSGASFDISRSGGVYTLDAVNQPGVGYVVGDSLFISGTEVGGQSPTNDVTVVIQEVSVAGQARTASITGAGTGYADDTNVATVGGAGTGFTVDITTTAGNITAIAISNPGSGYSDGDQVTVQAGNSDAIITIDLTYGAAGGVIDATVDGAAFDGNASYTALVGNYTAGQGIGVDIGFDVTYTNNVYSATLADREFSLVPSTANGGNGFNAIIEVFAENNVYTSANISTVETVVNPFWSVSGVGFGIDAEFSVQRNNASYTVTLLNGGSGFAPGDIITIPGTELNGSSPVNDVTITVSTASPLGEITSFTDEGTAPLSSNYAVGDLIKISGNVLGGTSPDEDFIARVATVGAGGAIATIDGVSGVAADRNELYEDVPFSTSGSGTGANIRVSLSGTTYSVFFVVGGTGFGPGDTITVSGSDIGGTTPTHDLTIAVQTVGGAGDVLTFTTTGIGNNAYQTIVGVADVSTTAGSNATFDVITDVVNRTYSVVVSQGGTDYAIGQTLTIFGTDVGGTDVDNDITVTVTSIDANYAITGISSTGTGSVGHSNYAQFDRIVIDGAQIGGVSDVNDAVVTIQSVNVDGEVLTFTIDGTAPDGVASYAGRTGATSGTGTGAAFNVTRTGTTYDAIVSLAGSGYLPTDTITIVGADLGGTTPTNNLTITVQTVGASGEIETITVAGTAVNIGEAGGVTGLIEQGAGATFDVVLAAGAYTTTINTGGAGYGAGQTIVIPGNVLGGTTPTNDLTITVSTVNNAGEITAITDSGTGSTGTASYTNVAVSTIQSTGLSATFDVTRSGGLYGNVAVNQPGTGYITGQRIIVPGTELGGVTPDNDLQLQIIADSGNNGAITNATVFSGTALAGDSLDLISAVTMTEPTSGTIPKFEPVTFEALATIEIQFSTAHGIVPGGSFLVAVQSDDGINNHALVAGAYQATEVTSLQSLRYQARAAGSIDTTATDIIGSVYLRPDTFFVHRPYDGGVQLGTGGPQHGAQAIRQSKKYIRYQSGKGIMYTTGALFAPSYDIRSAEAEGIEVGSEITVTCDDNDHGLQIGGRVRLLGIETPGYNQDYTVTEVVNERVFKVRAQRRLGSTSAVVGFSAQVSVLSWHGATVRSGIFDDQNGIFWEYDGTQISVVQRTATKQIAGTVAINVDSNELRGNNTRFRDQIKAGDRIVIRGMTHVVSNVATQTLAYVTPDYRGVINVLEAKACLVFDKKTRQTDFNLDTLDGNGPSKYDMDVSKMQMIGIQYSWYGAGFIDFMLRGSDGNFIFAHRMRNSNINTEAFMRSGNLPVRYEVTNEGPVGRLAEAIDDTQTSILLDDATFFPTSGTVYIDNEVINYTAKSGNYLQNCTRGGALTNFSAGAERSFRGGGADTHDVRTGVVLISNTITPLISHWGSAFLTDGGFDSDRGYIFSYAETQIPVSTTKQTAFMIRLAPSVSNAIVGDLGERELLNRAQLLLQGIEITSEAGDGNGIVIEGVLNPQNYPLNPGDVNWSGLGTLAQGGQPSFAQVAPGGGVTWTSGASTSTQAVTTQAFPTGTITLRDVYGRSIYNNYNAVWITDQDYNTYRNQGLGVGDYISGATLRPNTTITGFGNRFNRSGTNYRPVFLSQNSQGETDNDTTVTVQKRWRTSNTSVVWFNATSWAASGATNGTDVDDAKFPAGTIVSNVSLEDYFGTTYYAVTFNNTSDSSSMTPGTTQVTFLFQEPPYAQPGETVFSFIANPGERSTLSLEELKELTNTTLGGRGTFPNGPDVLAINVYKVAGTDTNANIILRWGEAQA